LDIDASSDRLVTGYGSLLGSVMVVRITVALLEQRGLS
jgi:hypothetical protein